MAQTVGLLGAGVAGAGVAKGLKDLNKLRKPRSTCWTSYKFVIACGCLCRRRFEPSQLSPWSDRAAATAEH